MSTFLDSEQAVIAKYGKAREHITLLRDKSTVLFGVDATELHNHSELKKKKFDVIIFMFPHTGVSNFAPGRAVQIQQVLKATKRLYASS